MGRWLHLLLALTPVLFGPAFGSSRCIIAGDCCCAPAAEDDAAEDDAAEDDAGAGDAGAGDTRGSCPGCVDTEPETGSDADAPEDGGLGCGCCVALWCAAPPALLVQTPTVDDADEPPAPILVGRAPGPRLRPPIA